MPANMRVIKIRFSTKDCQACPVLSLCTSSKSRVPRRLLSVRPQQQYEALQAARKRQVTEDFSRQYALRQGIEATISEGACEPLTYGALAILVWTRPTSSM
jgi:Transposase DDE domain